MRRDSVSQLLIFPGGTLGLHHIVRGEVKVFIIRYGPEDHRWRTDTHMKADLERFKASFAWVNPGRFAKVRGLSSQSALYLDQPGRPPLDYVGIDL